MTIEAFDSIVHAWFATARHPRFQRPYTDLAYQPMVELLAYLRANDFTTYIASGGAIKFMRRRGGKLWHPAGAGEREQRQGLPAALCGRGGFRRSMPSGR